MQNMPGADAVTCLTALTDKVGGKTKVRHQAQSRKYILFIEQDRELRTKLVAAFIHAGYHVLVTEGAEEAAEIMIRIDSTHDAFDLVIIDASSGDSKNILTRFQRINNNVPVFTVMDDADKALIIDMLNKNQADFIEDYIESHAKALKA